MIEGKPIPKLHQQFQVTLMNGQSTKAIGVKNFER
jgi:hypothetical protein